MFSNTVETTLFLCVTTPHPKRNRTRVCSRTFSHLYQITNKPNTGFKTQVYTYMKLFRSAKWWTFISQWSKFHFSICPLPKHKISICSVSVHQCSPLCKVWWSKANDRREVTSRSSNLLLDLFLRKKQKQHSTWKLLFSFHQMFHKCESIIVINKLCSGKLKTLSYA